MAKERRRPKFTPETRAKILGAISAGAGLELAAKIGGVTRETVYYWIRRSPSFAEEVEIAREAAAERVEAALFKNATEKMNVISQIFYLTNRRPDRWKRNPDRALADGKEVIEIVEGGEGEGEGA